MMEQVSGTVGAVCVGREADLTGQGRTHRSAFVKSSVDGPVRLGMLGLEGDEQVYHDHGGPDQALLVYSHDHYAFWLERLGLDLPAAGAMAENLTVTGLTEDTVHIGDVLSVGDTRIQITSPRGPCFKLAARYATRELPRVMQETSRTGYLMRVLATGTVEAGMQIDLVDRPEDSLTVAEAARVVNRDRDDWEVVERLVSVRALADAMRTKLEARLRRRDAGSDAARLYGDD